MFFPVVCCIVTIALQQICATLATDSAEPDSEAIDFSKVLKTSTFVDKSLLIEEFFKDKEINLIVSPPGFGKSTNINMLKHFLEITVNPKGKPIDPKTTPNHRLFAENNLNIYKNVEFFDEHFGKYPVVHIDYSVLNVTNYESAMTTFSRVLNATFRPHQYLLNNSKLWMGDDTKLFSKFTYSEEPLDEHDMGFALKFLCRLLRDHFKKKVVVLIDNYNNYLNSIPDMDIEEKEDVISFLEYLHDDLLKVNPFLNRALLTGVQVDAVVLPKKIKKHTFSDKRFSRYFGVTDKEIDTMFKKVFKSDDVNIRKSFDKTDNIQTFITLETPVCKLYNIRDVLSFIKANLKTV